MRIFSCPRCRAEDISADAHPTRVLDNGVERPVFVCRNCYRAAELEFRIASQTADLGYVPLAIRDGLRLLRDFYRARLAETIASAFAPPSTGSSVGSPSICSEARPRLAL